MGRRRRKEREHGGKRELTELDWQQVGLYSGGRKSLVERHIRGLGRWTGEDGPPGCAPRPRVATLKSFSTIRCVAGPSVRLVPLLMSSTAMTPSFHPLSVDVPSYKLSIFIINFSWVTHASGTRHQPRSGRVRLLWSRFPMFRSKFTLQS